MHSMTVLADVDRRVPVMPQVADDDVDLTAADERLLADFPVDTAAAAQPGNRMAERLAAEAARAQAQGYIDAKIDSTGKVRRKGGLADFSERRSDVFYVSPFLVHVRPNFNSRDFSTPANQRHVIAMAHSIKERGVRRPLDVHYAEGKIWVTDGECRWRATMLAINLLGAEIEAIPVQTGGRGESDEDRFFMPLEANSGLQLGPLEVGEHYRKALARGLTTRKIAARLHVSETLVIQRIELAAQATPLIRDMVMNDRVAAATALKILRAAPTPAAADAVLSRAAENASKQGKSKVMPKMVAASAAAAADDAPVSVTRASAKRFRELFATVAITADPAGGATLVLTPAEYAQYQRLMTSA